MTATTNATSVPGTTPTAVGNALVGTPTTTAPTTSPGSPSASTTTSAAASPCITEGETWIPWFSDDGPGPYSRCVSPPPVYQLKQTNKFLHMAVLARDRRVNELERSNQELRARNADLEARIEETVYELKGEIAGLRHEAAERARLS